MNDITIRPKRLGRPPKLARTDDFDTRDMLVRCGVEVLTEQGFMATGIDGILKRIGVPKGSFYHYFASKEAFGLEVLASYARYFSRRLDRWLLDEALSPLERLAGFVQHSKLSMARHDFRRGCLVGNLGQEVSVLPPGFRDALESIFMDWQRRLSICFEEAQRAGELPEYADCADLAAYFWIGWEGAVLRARLVQNANPLNIFIAGFLRGLPR